MKTVHLNYNNRPAGGMAILKALFLPRKGFNTVAGLPDLHAHWHGARVDQVALQKYCSVLDIPPSEYVSICYPHVMAGTLHMSLLSHKSFPIRLLGALHLKNRIVQHRPIRTGDVMNIDAKLGDFRLVDKGVEFDLVTELAVGSELVWHETSIYFVRGRFAEHDPPFGVCSFELPSLLDPGVIHSWTIPTSFGRQYASISGDYNPIHLSSMAAKMFGFKRDIAHGFAVLSQALNYVETVYDTTIVEQPAQLDVIFKGPVFLGDGVCIKQSVKQANGRFDVYCDNNSRPSMCVAIDAVNEA